MPDAEHDAQAAAQGRPDDNPPLIKDRGVVYGGTAGGSIATARDFRGPAIRPEPNLDDRPSDSEG